MIVERPAESQWQDVVRVYGPPKFLDQQPQPGVGHFRPAEESPQPGHGPHHPAGHQRHAHEPSGDEEG